MTRPTGSDSASRSSLFDDIARTDISPAKHSESIFEFLNRADGRVSARVRTLMDEWWNEHPDSAQANVRGQIRSGDDHALRAAFFEMYGYQLLRRARDTVIEHPVTETKRQPEFLATSEGASPLVMEMTSTGASPADRSRARRRDTIIDQINSWEIPNFLLHIVVASEGPGNPSLRRLRRELLDWIVALDVDKIAAMKAASPNYLTDKSVPRHIWNEAGWSIEFRVIPRKPEWRAPTKDAIGLYGPAAWFVGNPEPIRRRLAEKASAYGDFAGPFVVAVLLDLVVSDDTSVTAVLYGDEAVTISMDDFDAGEFVRRPNGSWFKPDGWHHTNVSAVLAVSGLLPWTVNTAVPTLWHHPAAQFPVDEIAPILRQATPNLNTGRVEFSAPAIDPAAFFDLRSDWPGPETSG